MIGAAPLAYALAAAHPEAVRRLVYIWMLSSRAVATTSHKVVGAGTISST